MAWGTYNWEIDGFKYTDPETKRTHVFKVIGECEDGDMSKKLTEIIIWVRTGSVYNFRHRRLDSEIVKKLLANDKLFCDPLRTVVTNRYSD